MQKIPYKYLKEHKITVLKFLDNDLSENAKFEFKDKPDPLLDVLAK